MFCILNIFRELPKLALNNNMLCAVVVILYYIVIVYVINYVDVSPEYAVADDVVVGVAVGKMK